MKRAGSNCYAYVGFYDEDNIVSGTGSNLTAANTKYLVLGKAASASGIPSTVPAGSFFISPGSGTQLTLKTGDRLLKIDPVRFCKTTADVNAEQGSIDVGDDCDPGAQILDGIITFSGSIAGFFQYDSVTEEFDDVTKDILNRFLKIVEDTGSGSYTAHPVDDSKAFLMVLLNGNAKTGKENWLFIPINITSLGITMGNAEGQSKNISWTKAEGEAVLYIVPKAAA
jgi:hypothetical protein